VIEGVTAYHSLKDVVSKVATPGELAVSVITPPKVTLGVVQEAIDAGGQLITTIFQS
jgi:hypothetical protein